MGFEIIFYARIGGGFGLVQKIEQDFHVNYTNNQ